MKATNFRIDLWTSTSDMLDLIVRKKIPLPIGWTCSVQTLGCMMREGVIDVVPSGGHWVLLYMGRVITPTESMTFGD